MKRYLCIHGHFYQPPRENPWLEAIELQDSASPYHDWNERITAECYAPNAAARILNDREWIKKIYNNYSRISFNFGPTLLDWLESNEPDVYNALIEADRTSQERFSGHGSAMAQAYNHLIMPLANRRDKYTQVIWGIKDFEKHFGRKPEGMWLPETAVDLESLEVMAECGIKFTVLTQYQARRFRKIGSSSWHEVGSKGIDPSMPYQVRLPESGRTINIFFYDGPISQAVAFEELLENGERFAHRLIEGFSEKRSWPQLVHIATDGETYGHHHRHGEMALAYTLDYIETNNLARITNYGEFLEMYPPTHEAEILENTAWSCAHGVERWRSDCGCNTGNQFLSQAWRTPLRNSLNWLRDTITPEYEKCAQLFIKDPWKARNDYIDVVLSRSNETIDHFLAKHAIHKLDAAEKVTVLKLMEIQRQAMLMFTSCGWFFDDISGIETVQIIQYARRVIELAQELFNSTLEPGFLEILSQAKSNIPEHRDGAFIYERLATPAMINLLRVGAHYAISSLFEDYSQESNIFCYTVQQLDKKSFNAGKAMLTIGRAKITSQITLESINASYGVVFLNYQNVKGGVRVYMGNEAYEEMVQGVTKAFNQEDITNVIRVLEQYFQEGVIYSLKQLFRDQQRKIMNLILKSTMTELKTDYQKVYERNASLMQFLKELDCPLPHALKCAADFHLNSGLRQAFGSEVLDIEHIKNLLNEVRMLEINLDSDKLGYVLKLNMEQAAGELIINPENITLLKKLDTMTGLARSLPFDIDLGKVQNTYYTLLQTFYIKQKENAKQGDDNSKAWLNLFDTLGEKLKIQRGG